jgi:hypothetical protein
MHRVYADSLTGLAGSASSSSGCDNNFDESLPKLIASPIKRQAKLGTVKRKLVGRKYYFRVRREKRTNSFSLLVPEYTVFFYYLAVAMKSAEPLPDDISAKFVDSPKVQLETCS